MKDVPSIKPTNLFWLEGYQSQSATIPRDKFDFVCFAFAMDMDNSTNIACLQPQFQQGL